MQDFSPVALRTLILKHAEDCCLSRLIVVFVDPLRSPHFLVFPHWVHLLQPLHPDSLHSLHSLHSLQPLDCVPQSAGLAFGQKRGKTRPRQLPKRLIGPANLREAMQRTAGFVLDEERGTFAQLEMQLWQHLWPQLMRSGRRCLRQIGQLAVLTILLIIRLLADF